MLARDALAPWIRDAAERLGKAFAAERVLVFGSHATGQATRHSDLDLFVVCETDERAPDRIERALRTLVDLRVPVDPIVYTPDELRERSASKFIQHVLAMGVVAYER